MSKIISFHQGQGHYDRERELRVDYASEAEWVQTAEGETMRMWDGTIAPAPERMLTLRLRRFVSIMPDYK